MAVIDTVICANWDEFATHARSLQSPWVFRGHASANWLLETTIERTPKGMQLLQAEATLLREFQRRAHHHVPQAQVPRTLGEWLALMQHYGAPTRLLDFTSSPYVAAYFALESPPPDKATHCAIWALDVGWCEEASGKLALSADSRLREIAEELSNAIVGQVGYTSPGLAANFLINRIHPGAATLPTSGVAGVFPLNLDRLSDRMSVQQGVLLWFADAKRSFMENLMELEGKAGLRKFIIPVTETERALRELRRMNITRASLFPDLEGFARSLRHLLVVEPSAERLSRIMEDMNGVLERRAVRERPKPSAAG